MFTSTKSRIPISDGGHIEVSVFVKAAHYPVAEQIRFKIDTGADCCTINKAALRGLGYNDAWLAANIRYDPKRVLVSAGIATPATYVELPLVQFCGRDFRNWAFHIKPEMNADFSRLIGMDMLRNFDMEILHSQWEAALTPIKAPAYNLPLPHRGEVLELSVV